MKTIFTASLITALAISAYNLAGCASTDKRLSKAIDKYCQLPYSERMVYRELVNQGDHKITVECN